MMKTCSECKHWHPIDFPNGTPTEYGVCVTTALETVAEAPNSHKEACKAHFEPKEGDDV